MPERDVLSLTVVVFEQPPTGIDPYDGLDVAPEPGVPEPARAEVERVVRDADCASCATCCAQPVGFVLHEPLDYDDTRPAGMFWQYTAVVIDGERAWSVCEDCTQVLIGPSDD